METDSTDSPVEDGFLEGINSIQFYLYSAKWEQKLPQGTSHMKQV